MQLFFPKNFQNQLKKLKKKYPNVKKDCLDRLKTVDLEKEVSVGRSIYKVRIKSSDLQKGKSGGFRSYVYAYKRRDLLAPLCIYVKAEKESISENQLNHYFNKGIHELVVSLREVFSHPRMSLNELE